jgi:hypothetical protein
VPVLEDYYECLHHKKEVGYAPERGVFEYDRITADVLLLLLGHKSTSITNSISKSGGSTPSRRCTQSGRDKKLGIVGQER